MQNSKSTPKFCPSKEALLVRGRASDLQQQSWLPVAGAVAGAGFGWMVALV